MPFVLDTSVTMGWCFRDEQTAYGLEVFRSLRGDRAFVPAVWPLEVANVLLVGERRSRLTIAETERFVRLLRSLPIVVDSAAIDTASLAVVPIGRAHTLSTYDASYLELALRRGLPLATQDNRLRAVAAHLGVPIFDLQVDADSTNGQGTT